jgi:hypothetical protein
LACGRATAQIGPENSAGCGSGSMFESECHALLSGGTNATQSIVSPKKREYRFFVPLARHKCDTNSKILVCVDGRQLTHENWASTHENRLFCRVCVSIKLSRVSASRHKHIFLTNRSPGIIQFEFKISASNSECTSNI